MTMNTRTWHFGNLRIRKMPIVLVLILLPVILVLAAAAALFVGLAMAALGVIAAAVATISYAVRRRLFGRESRMDDFRKTTPAALPESGKVHDIQVDEIIVRKDP